MVDIDGREGVAVYLDETWNGWVSMIIEFDTDDTSTLQYLWWCNNDCKDEDWFISILSNTIRIQSGSDSGGDSGLWTAPFSTTGRHVFGISFHCSTDETQDPIMSLDGSTLTVTEVDTPVDMDGLGTGKHYFGAKQLTTSVLSGALGLIKVVYGTKYSQARLNKLTSCNNALYILQDAKGDETNSHCWFNNEYYHGEACPSADTLVANGDVAHAWDDTAGTAWESIQFDANSIYTGTSSVVTTCNFATFTKEGTIMAIVSAIVYDNSGETCTVDWNKGDGGGVFDTLTIPDGNSSKADLYMTGVDWTQAEIDGLTADFNANATIDKGNENKIVFAGLSFYDYKKLLKDRIGGCHLFGRDFVGQRNKGMSYA